MPLVLSYGSLCGCSMRGLFLTVLAAALCLHGELDAREGLLSCSLDGRGTPNEIGVCVEFPAGTSRPGFYCTDEMRITYVSCSMRGRVGSCEMASESGPFLVHYYEPHRQGSSLQAFCSARGKYHPVGSMYILSLPKKAEPELKANVVLEQTKEVAAWPPSDGEGPAESCDLMAGLLRRMFDSAPEKPAGCKEFEKQEAERIGKTGELSARARAYIVSRIPLICEAKQKGSTFGGFEADMRKSGVCN
jgi:hypothetical protein